MKKLFLALIPLVLLGCSSPSSNSTTIEPTVPETPVAEPEKEKVQIGSELLINDGDVLFKWVDSASFEAHLTGSIRHILIKKDLTKNENLYFVEESASGFKALLARCSDEDLQNIAKFFKEHVEGSELAITFYPITEFYSSMEGSNSDKYIVNFSIDAKDDHKLDMYITGIENSDFNTHVSFEFSNEGTATAVMDGFVLHNNDMFIKTIYDEIPVYAD